MAEVSSEQGLFRPEAHAYAARRLEGEVILFSPPSLRWLTVALVTIFALAVTFAACATHVRKETAAGWLVPTAEEEIAKLISDLPITRVVIAHRPALLSHADRVYEIRGGKLGLRTERATANQHAGGLEPA